MSFLVFCLGLAVVCVTAQSSCATQEFFNWTVSDRLCSGAPDSAGPWNTGDLVRLRSTAPCTSGLASFTCVEGVFIASGLSCEACCEIQTMFNWSASGKTCSGSPLYTGPWVSGTYIGNIASSDPCNRGYAEFVCVDGVVNRISSSCYSCCPARDTFVWTVSESLCSGQPESYSGPWQNGDSVRALAQSTGCVGSASFSCVDGEFVLLEGSSCDCSSASSTIETQTLWSTTTLTSIVTATVASTSSPTTTKTTTTTTTFTTEGMTTMMPSTFLETTVTTTTSDTNQPDQNFSCFSSSVDSCDGNCPCGCYQFSTVPSCNDAGECTSCKRYTWGSKCGQKCSCNCYQYDPGRWCDAGSGVCTNCKLSRWGTNFCENECAPGCYEFSQVSSCDRNNGTCVSCRNGLWGTDFCEKTCATGCYPYSTIPVCDRNNGTCAGCKSGLWGDLCQNTCPNGCYRYSTIPICVRSNGTCAGCNNGLWGGFCEKPCPCGCYGYSASSICDKMTGVCRGCQNGWSGSFCNISSSNSTTPPNCPWLSNLVATASPADLNDDFHVNIFDIVSVIENWGCVGDSCSGDVNHDGIVDLRDIVMLISAWTG